MKAVIVEIKKTWVAALCSDGRIIRIKNKHYMIGQEINMKSNNNRLVKFAASAAAALVIFAVPAWAYLTPYSYVSIDVNPSVEFSLNRFDKVLSIKAVNDDGEEILKEIDLNGLKNEDINSAVKEVINEIKQSGFLGEDGGVVVAASSKTEEKTEQLKEKVKTTVEDEVKGSKDSKDSKDSGKVDLEENDQNNTDINNAEDTEDTENIKDKANSSVEVEAIGVGQERVAEARNLGVTPGKLNLVEKLQASTDEKTYDTKEWLNKPVKDIMKEIKENKKAAEEKEKNKSNENINKKSNDSNAVNNNADTNSKNTKNKKK